MRQPKCECGNCRYCKKRAHYLNNVERFKQKRREYYQENKLYIIQRVNDWRRKNRSRVNEANKRYRETEVGQMHRSEIERRADLKRLYGITDTWYEDKLKEQEGKCAICGTANNQAKNRRLHVDHSHLTGQNRGILCHHCNVALHLLEKDSEWAKKALDYLDRYEREYWKEAEARYGRPDKT